MQIEQQSDNVIQEKMYTFDIGEKDSLFVSGEKVREAVQQGSQLKPSEFPPDKSGQAFSKYVLYTLMKNGEKVNLDWLVRSKSKNALFCFPCRLVSQLIHSHRSALAIPCGYSIENRVPEHERINDHKTSYINWRQYEIQNQTGTSIDSMLQKGIESEAARWKQILKKILHAILFLGKRGLAFRGSITTLGDPENSSFLGILELLSHYDPVLNEHLEKVKESQVKMKLFVLLRGKDER